MKTRLNRLFALLMALMMMFSMIPASSLATEGDGTSDASGQASPMDSCAIAMLQLIVL